MGMEVEVKSGKRISVVMPTYNGERFIELQISSILSQLGKNDELIISDDGSTDGTIRLIGNFKKMDSRVRVLRGPGRGVIANVSNALAAAEGKYIFLADQDDYWEPGKVKKMLTAFAKTHAPLIVHDATVVTANGSGIIAPSFFATKNCHAGYLRNIIRNSYIGCCMAFRREILKYALPIPEDIKMHDQWIGMVAEALAKGKAGAGKCRKPVFFASKLIKYRRHSANVSSMKHDPALKMILYRLRLIINLRSRGL